MNTSIKSLAAAAIAVIAIASAGSASAQTIYFGENLNPSQSASGAPVTARNAFLSSLSGVSTEGFETFSQGISPSSLSFNGSAGTISASFSSNSGFICAVNGCGGLGRFATEGTNYFDVASTFTAVFSSSIAAFGFYGTDIGDINGQLTIELMRNAGASTFLTVSNTLGAPDGSLLFYGVIDKLNPFDGVRFGNTATGFDYFGFDQLTIGDVAQVTPSVPEPSTWAMMIAGFGMVGFAARRRQSVKATVAYA